MPGISAAMGMSMGILRILIVWPPKVYNMLTHSLLAQYAHHHVLVYILECTRQPSVHTITVVLSSVQKVLNSWIRYLLMLVTSVRNLIVILIFIFPERSANSIRDLVIFGRPLMKKNHSFHIINWMLTSSWRWRVTRSKGCTSTNIRSWYSPFPRTNGIVLWCTCERRQTSR